MGFIIRVINAMGRQHGPGTCDKHTWAVALKSGNQGLCGRSTRLSIMSLGVGDVSQHSL